MIFIISSYFYTKKKTKRFESLSTQNHLKYYNKSIKFQKNILLIKFEASFFFWLFSLEGGRGKKGEEGGRGGC